MYSKVFGYLKEFIRSRLEEDVWARHVWLLGQYEYMNGLGYFRSAANSIPVDVHGSPIPWFTYPSIAFLGARLSKDLTLFEYGSGNSTRYFAERVSSVHSVEHSLDWYDRLRTRLPENVTYSFCELDRDGRYCRSALETGHTFDVVVIDGRDRVNCARHSYQALSDRGVVVWDNSEREQYRPGFQFLEGYGFKRIDFWGPAPCSGTGYCTSIFYRLGNCLDI